jgi:hypothetical protein
MPALRQTVDERTRHVRTLVDAASAELKQVVAWGVRDYFAQLGNACPRDGFCPVTGLTQQELLHVAASAHDMLDTLPPLSVPYVIKSLSLQLGVVQQSFGPQSKLTLHQAQHRIWSEPASQRTPPTAGEGEKE